jgi:hypothetical protein
MLSSLPAGIRRCPRCRYAGEGIGYFRRPGHLALLAAATVFTWGLGGVVYWLLRRRRRVCPNCGLTWPEWEAPLPPSGEPGEVVRAEPPLPSDGLKRRVLGVVLALLGVLAMGIGLGEWEFAPMVGGAVLGMAGGASALWGWAARKERRTALRHALERRVLQLATRRGGSLTVTEVASELDLSLGAAEGVLIGMDDGFRVRAEVTDDGVLVFEFPEVQRRQLPG